MEILVKKQRIKVSEEENKLSNISHYEKEAAGYENQKKFCIENKKRVFGDLQKISKISNRGKVLDIASGTGFLADLAKDHFDEVYSLDSSKEMLESQKKKGIPSTLVVATSDNIPFKEEYFDACITSSFLHHLVNFKSTFKETYRVLKKGGILYVDYEPSRIYFRFTYAIVTSLFRKPRTEFTDEEKIAEYQQGVLGGVSIAEVKKELREAGFRKIKVFFVDFGFEAVAKRLFGKRGDSLIKLLNIPPFNILLFSKVCFTARK